MSKPSKNIPMPISHMIRRWNGEIGRRSSRAPALTVTCLLRLCEQGHAAGRQRFNRQSAVLVEGVLLCQLEKFFAAAGRACVEPKNPLDKRIGVAGEAVGRADL